MSYRYNDEPIKPEDALRRFEVRNGATLRVTFGCYYMRGHDSLYHDHVGWPNPTSPDGVCQDVSNMRLHTFPRGRKTVELDEIDLAGEGYGECYVAFEDNDAAQYLTASAWIDEADSNLVRMTVQTALPPFKDKPVDVRFTLFAKNEANGNVDAVAHAFVTVLPGPGQRIS